MVSSSCDERARKQCYAITVRKLPIEQDRLMHAHLQCFTRLFDGRHVVDDIAAFRENTDDSPPPLPARRPPEANASTLLPGSVYRPVATGTQEQELDHKDWNLNETFIVSFACGKNLR
jgi:hypothetical protein